MFHRVWGGVAENRVFGTSKAKIFNILALYLFVAILHFFRSSC